MSVIVELFDRIQGTNALIAEYGEFPATVLG
jgi:hypothetical protein